MALARACHHPSEAPRVKGLENIDTTFTSNEVVIGISKKCCRCCSLFAQHMATSLQEGQEELHFVLPGTHSIIYPWLPPAFGVPDHVLASMRRVLFATFHHVAVQHDAGFTSTQSSPASDDIEDGPMQTEQWASSQGKK
ncbi:hypothetical protein BV20DRAFT_974999 [Pilatotrama ljubarskyi]|nr:hypothetical protein BV20DRAFT_974999 [Pilatotrama ljubarskyi]